MNSVMSIGALLLKTIITFLVRTMFIFTFGKTILGFNAVMTNVLTILSLAELGVGTSMSFYLYKPIVNQDNELIKSYLVNFRKLYRIIATVVGIIGIAIIPIVDNLVNAKHLNFNIEIAYLLFLLNTIASYLLNYKRSILIADQKNYITLMLDLISFLVVSVLQIISMIYLQNFYIHLILQVVGTIIGNILISTYVNQHYKLIINSKYTELSDIKKTEFYKNLVGNFTSKLGSVVVFGTDNLLINTYAGLKIVGLYSNYVLITNTIQSVIKQSLSAITPSIGNLIVEKNSDHVFNTFKNTYFFNCGISYITGLMIAISINPFIKIWIGKSFILSQTTLTLIIINYILVTNRSIIIAFCDAYGLFWEQRWNPVLEAILNLVLSIILGEQLGIDGILLGTTFSTILTVFWFEPFLLFKKGLRMKVFKYWQLWTKYNLLFLIINSLGYLAAFKLNSNNIFEILLKGIFFLIITTLLISVFFWKDSSYQYWKQLVVHNIKKKL